MRSTRFVLIGLALLAVSVSSAPAVASGAVVACASDGGAVASALTRIKQSVDPCGQSAEILAVLDKVEDCSAHVCTDAAARRNYFDRSTSVVGSPTRTITWNPALRSEVEVVCHASSREPLLRDPTASLLHELVHAAQDCDGVNPGENELEAVRIENIYRRAAGLCQRSGYGQERLPESMVVSCPQQQPCFCGSPAADDPAVEAGLTAHPAAVASDSEL
jgi:hypothetical protein